MMKAKKIEVVEVEGEGLLSMLGERVLLMCVNYFYEGILEGVNDKCCLLSDVGIVYETGPWTSDKWQDRQELPENQYVMLQSIESFGLSPKMVILDD